MTTGITSDLRLEHDVKQLEQQIMQLKFGMERYDTMRTESAEMNQQISELLAMRENESLRHAGVVHAMKVAVARRRRRARARSFARSLAR